MGFSELLESMFGLSEDNQIKKYNDEQINVLYQGLKHLKTKQRQINKNKIGGLMEGFKTPKALTDATAKEEGHLKKMKTEYNQAISNYGTEYKAFMEAYAAAAGNQKTCLSDCMKQHTATGTQGKRLRESCQAGCIIKGPNITTCTDTYKGWQNDTTQKCTQMTSGKCSKGKVEMGQATAVNNASNSDIKSTTIARGCCACGGGSGGPPKAKVRGKNIGDCNDIYSGFGLTQGDGNSPAVINACKTAPYNEQQKSSNLYLEYGKLRAKNSALMAQAEQLFGKVNKMKDIRKGIQTILTREEREMKNRYDEFSNTYNKIKTLDQSGGEENTTLNAQADDAILKEQSESFRYYAWIILALLVTSTTLWKMNQKKV
tara:strand:- start:3117 stop:4235 length:1119 start_codon:yes stop_codon:yes gene_type:complete